MNPAGLAAAPLSPWDEDELVERMSRGLAQAAARLDLEQARRGLDSLAEAELQQLILAALHSAGIPTARERRYPDAALNLPLRNRGRRCDFCLLAPPAGGDGAADYWIELKRVAQFKAGEPDWSYPRRMQQLLPRDLCKLAQDSVIFHAGLLVLLFAENRATGLADLRQWKQLALQQDCPAGAARIRDFALRTHCGNAHCILALFPLRRL